MIKKIGAWISKNRILTILICAAAAALICICVFAHKGNSTAVNVERVSTAVTYSTDIPSSDDSYPGAALKSNEINNKTQETESAITQSSETGTVSGTYVVEYEIIEQDVTDDEKNTDDRQKIGEKEENNRKAETVKNDDSTQKSIIKKNGTYCTFSISCRTVLDNKNTVSDRVYAKIPSDGWIYRPHQISFTEGESVFDVLKRVCSDNDIALDYSYNAFFNTAYIKGIGSLFEFDCGNQSGWLYFVNSQTPNYGCSNYQLSGGDVVEFRYSCRGLGADLT